MADGTILAWMMFWSLIHDWEILAGFIGMGFVIRTIYNNSQPYEA